MLPNGERPELLDVTDVRAIRALAHPVRLAILDHVRDERTVNATECAALTGESPQACSYHLRALAKWGFLRRTSADDGRETRWIAAARAFRFLASSGEIGVAADALRDYVLRRDERALADFLRHEHELEPEWAEAAHLTTATLHMTAAELRELESELGRLVDRYRRRRGERPAGSRRVHFLARAFPTLPNEEENAR